MAPISASQNPAPVNVAALMPSSEMPELVIWLPPAPMVAAAATGSSRSQVSEDTSGNWVSSDGAANDPTRGMVATGISR